MTEAPPEGPGLYLLGPDDLGAPSRPLEPGLAALEGLLADVPAEALLLRSSHLTDEEARGALARLMAVGETSGTAVLIDRLSLGRACDGLHLAWDKAGVAAARKALGPERSLGILVPAERHAAMEAAEAGGDYVAFPAAAEGDFALIDWWSEIAVVPAVAFDPPDLESARAATAAGADFLALGRLLWESEFAPAEVLLALRSGAG